MSLVINTGSLKSIRHNGDDKKDVSAFQKKTRRKSN